MKHNIIETKSTWTLHRDLYKNIEKIRSTNKNGYNLRLLVWDGRHTKIALDRFFPKL